MRKIIFGFIASILMPNLSFGQATLEHTYTSDIQDYSMTNVVSFYADDLYYFTFSRANQLIQVYDQNHSDLYSFTIPVEADYYITEFILITDKLFNDDEQVEFLYKAYKNVGAGVQEFKVFLCDQNGLLLQSFTDRYYGGLKKTAENDYKLILGSDYNSTTSGFDYDIYSLSGTLSIEQQELYAKNISLAYPNPTNGIINISNKLSNNENATLEVFDIQGKKVINKTVINNNEIIKLDVSILSNGIYIYKLNGESGKFIKK